MAGVGSSHVATRATGEHHPRRPGKPGGEKLNHERPDKGLPVSASRDGAEQGKRRCRRVRGSLSFLPPEITVSKPKGGHRANLVRAEAWTCDSEDV